MSGSEEADDQVEDYGENDADKEHGHYGKVNGCVTQVEYSIAGESSQTRQAAEANEKQAEENQNTSRYQQRPAYQVHGLPHIEWDWPPALAAAMVLTRSMAMVMGPTPPGTGEMALATSDTASKSTSPTNR